jgi:hypothetical protein
MFLHLLCRIKAYVLSNDVNRLAVLVIHFSPMVVSPLVAIGTLNVVTYPNVEDVQSIGLHMYVNYSHLQTGQLEARSALVRRVLNSRACF